ncbi:MAG TPA: hypothetical protein EYP74_06505 [Anaerolineales bacterium]|nr:hypothetical protein [Anaerolineales bacterium]
MKKKLFVLVLALMFVLGLTAGTNAQEYSFELEKEIVHVYYNEDGSMSLDYTFFFKNNAGAHIIDFIDVGTPNNSWRFSSVSADINGQAVKISTDYQGSGSGFAIDMGGYAIPAGGSAKVHVYVGYIDEVLYPNDEAEDYASAVFGTTYFGGQYVTGNTDMSISLHLPPGVQPDEAIYYYPSDNWDGNQEPISKIDENGRVTYTWHHASANGYTQYQFGVSFPDKYVPASAIITPSWLEKMGLDADTLFGLFICLGIVFFFVGIPIISSISARKRKMKYMSPKIAIEGHGIKRGLTAVESAILMEEPLDKVMTMILFGVIKKDAATVTNRDPLKIEVAKPIPEGLHKYEKDFLAAFADGKNNRAVQRKKMQKVTVDLIESVGKKMKGFSRKETVAYYKKIMERAWTQIETADTPEIMSEKYDKALEWTMLDDNYQDRTTSVFRHRPVYTPMWWRRYDPSFGRSAAGKSVSVPSSGGKSLASSMPQLPGANFAASIVGGAQTFSNKVVGNLNKFTSPVTQKTNPLPIRTSSGGSSSGGSSCACACACAGCACACAGGGR